MAAAALGVARGVGGLAAVRGVVDLGAVRGAVDQGAVACEITSKPVKQRSVTCSWLILALFHWQSKLFLFPLPARIHREFIG